MNAGSDERDALGGGRLLDFLRSRRWFGDKAAATAAQMRDVVRLPWDGGRYVVARVEVTVDGAPARVYQVPLCEERGQLADAVREQSFLRHLASDLARGASYEGESGVKWVIGPEGEQGLVVPTDAEIRVGSAEQSNTSIVFADEGILKLFRKVEPGENPDVELTRYLTVQAGFAHTPTLLGTIRFVDRDGTVTHAGMLQDFLPKSVDAWSHALARGRSYLAGGVPNEFAGEMERLGRITREMHDALARAPGELAPVRATGADVAQWIADTTAMMQRAMALLERNASRLPLPASREAEILVKRRAAYAAFVSGLGEAVGGEPGLLTRTHGDYHLGQVLRTANGDFMIIDFEGEPLRPLAERRRKASALRDVAGMLRSLAYAAATLAREAGGGKREADPGIEILTARWERDSRAAFLRGYFGEEGSNAAQAQSAGRTAHSALQLFETEKVFYELAYELNNRPEWAWIPMRGISRLLVKV